EASLRRLSESGYPLILDNFADSALGLLRVLPIDGVKLSRRLQLQALEHERAKQYLQGLVGLIHSLGAWVGATRVQTPEQAALLADVGCDRFQGYWFAAPRSVEHRSWLNRKGPM